MPEFYYKLQKWRSRKRERPEKLKFSYFVIANRFTDDQKNFTRKTKRRSLKQFKCFRAYPKIISEAAEKSGCLLAEARAN
jgi:hypothetical protein